MCMLSISIADISIYKYTHSYNLGVIQVGSRVHKRVPTKVLHSGASSRRGAYVALRGRCVECFDRAPPVVGHKTLMSDGRYIPCVTYACDVCRKHLCLDCFHRVYDHRKRGRSYDTVTLSP